MAYILNSVTLKDPITFDREVIEKSVVNVMMDNTTKKDITGSKEIFKLSFRALTPLQVSQLVNIYESFIPVYFEVTETNLTIAATRVLVSIDSREYSIGGPDYLEDMKITLTEVV